MHPYVPAQVRLLEAVSGHSFESILGAASNAQRISDTPRPPPMQVLLSYGW